ncbi:hypothetical protein H312_00785 [Anncaliia algerae PRA339]|uniref:ISXO2-like transposase domain-containing protein n=1 Tax=Anncaliia algerae PRA339 TaxID=1288291 RepID=A0A059F3G3_9MICR|nr:hypothetical protein H312_00785 [Anncaliia algerae PRA339]
MLGRKQNIRDFTKGIKMFVLPGSTIYTDCFCAYDSTCKDVNFDHFSTNHKLNVVDPIVNVHTNKIEGLNNGLKHLIKPRNGIRKILMVVHFIYFDVEETKIMSGKVSLML